MDVKLSILTNQYDEFGNVDTIQVNAIGKMFEKNKDIYVVYEEIEDSQKVTTTLKISDEEVSIKKYGYINSLMVFKENHKHYGNTHKADIRFCVVLLFCVCHFFH